MAAFEKYLTEFLDNETEYLKIPGYDCSVYHHHKEIYRHSNGFADLERKRPITQNTLYNIYSNTKVITCTAALQLYEQGKFLLEDRLDRFYPEFKHVKVQTAQGVKDAERPIRIKDLFCMTAGFAYADALKDVGVKFYQDSNGECPVSEMPKYLAEVPLKFEPGEHYRYGICHDVLGALIAKISGKSFAEYLDDNIFRPLGMENTGFYLEKLDEKRMAMQYCLDTVGNTPVSVGVENYLVPPVLKESGGGGLITSVDDYMKFQEALCKGNVILRKSTIDLMRLDHLNEIQRRDYGTDGTGISYGLGVRTTIDQAKCGAPVGFGSFGWHGAAGSYGSIDPENELTIFYVQHMHGIDVSRIHSVIRNIVYSFLN